MPEPIAKAEPQRATAKLTKPEVAFMRVLEERKARGEIVWWSEHPMSLKLADGSRYIPDYMVVTWDGTILVYEVKGTGGWNHVTFAGRGRPSGSEGGKSRAKFLFAVECFPLFRFMSAIQQRKKDGGGFDEEAYAPRLGYSAARFLYEAADEAAGSSA